jgi:hypothetical protein
VQNRQQDKFEEVMAYKHLYPRTYFPLNLVPQSFPPKCLLAPTRSGDLTKEEFTNAVVVAMAPITSRIVIYYAALAVLPLLVGRLIAAFSYIVEYHSIAHMPKHVYAKTLGKTLAVLEWVINNIFGVAIFSIALPYIFGKVDRAARSYARRRYQHPLWWLQLPKRPDKPAAWSTWFKQRFYAAHNAMSLSEQKMASAENSTQEKDKTQDSDEKKSKESKDWRWSDCWANLFRTER